MSGLKLNFADDSASTSIVGGKPVHSVKRKRQLSSSSSSSPSSEEEVEEEASKVVLEHAELNGESDTDKKKKHGQKSVPKKAPKKSSIHKTPEQSRPIYEDYLPDTANLDSKLEKIVKSFLEKNTPKQKDEDEEEAAADQQASSKPAPKKPSKAKVDQSKKQTADQKVLLQISKSFEVLQKKLNKALESANSSR